MNLSYLVTFKRYQGGRAGVFFADVPEAITAGSNEAEAPDRAQDALTAIWTMDVLCLCRARRKRASPSSYCRHARQSSSLNSKRRLPHRGCRHPQAW